MLAITIFCIAYFGIALGKIPGLIIDRVGVALLGAIAMMVFGVVTIEGAVGSINLPTILLLYSLMIISAQLRLGGFYTWVALKIVPYYTHPRLFLLITMLVSALLSALLANDIVCFAFTPILALSLIEAGLNPLPFLIGLAVSSNIGSAATIIGNPQNMLIGQTGHLSFSKFFFWCSPPSLLALISGYLIILWIYRQKFYSRKKETVEQEQPRQPFNKWQTSKGIFAILILISLFFSSIPREFSAIGIAGILLCSRKMKTRDIMGLVDWHLITLFCALFIIIHGISQSGYLDIVMKQLSNMGMNLHNLPILTGISAITSNLFSNVPATMLLISFLDPLEHAQWYTLAVSSTFAGNLFLLGSIANLIVVEQAANFDIKISFSQHAIVGIPVTLISLLILLFWIFIV
ncbi:MAG TPA: anion transporter [Desulfobacteraceae bacterium]|nr:anion transporter [Desulfobacteraceae bacterium]HPJ66660.1 anion transporter [Desulfobacteraceae bacterium]HPQ27779.1 anion transporter [Desulfobacteraceae bacterium]